MSKLPDYKAWRTEKTPAGDLRVGDIVYYSFFYYEITEIGTTHNRYYGKTVLALHCRALEEKPFTITFEAEPDNQWTRKIPPTEVKA